MLFTHPIAYLVVEFPGIILGIFIGLAWAELLRRRAEKKRKRNESGV